MTTILKLENVNVEFPMYKATARAQFNQLLSSKKGPLDTFKALDDINLELKLGDKIGLVGQNGAGKTTLLRVMAGILPPTSGKVVAYGTVLPLIQSGIYVIPRLSCLQNITLFGMRNKLSGEKLTRYTKSVREVADLEKFINLPVIKLSAGMRNRLVLSMLHATPADIIIMDEWVGTSDMKVLKRGEGLIQDLIDKSKVFILASHREKVLELYCSKKLELNSGKVVM